MADIERWITVNGAHIPIIKGESRARAVSNFIKSKQGKATERRKSARENEYFDYVLKNYIENKKGLRHVDNSLKGEELNARAREYTNNRADEHMRKKYGEKWRNGKIQIKDRAKTRDEIEDERFDKYDEYAHNAARNIRFDNRKNPLSQDELYDRAHAVAQASSMYDMDYKYGKGGTHENKQVKIGDEIRAARYKLKVDKETPTKKTIKGVHTNKVDWNGKNQEVEVHFWRGNPQLKNGGYNTTRNYTARTESGLMNQIRKSTKGGYGSMEYQSYNPKPKNYKMADANRQKVVKNLSEKSIKLDRQMSTASGKEYDRLAKEYEKNQRKLNAIGGKYIVGRKKKK